LFLKSAKDLVNEPSFRGWTSNKRGHFHCC
jgi:hypothetical protein